MDPAVTVTGNPTGSGPVAAVPDASLDHRAVAARRSRVEMSRVDLWSVLKVSLCFYLAGLAIVLIAGLVTWLLLDAAGQIRSFERFMGDILSAKNYHLVASEVLIGGVLIGLVRRGAGDRAHRHRRGALQRVLGPRGRYRGHARRGRLSGFTGFVSPGAAAPGTRCGGASKNRTYDLILIRDAL